MRQMLKLTKTLKQLDVCGFKRKDGHNKSADGNLSREIQKLCMDLYVHISTYINESLDPKNTIYEIQSTDVLEQEHEHYRKYQ